MKFAISILLAFTSAHVIASEQPVISGAGLISCGQFLEDKKDHGINDMYIHWVQGFLSGLNVADGRAGKKLVPLPDSPTINAYLVKYCTDQPLDRPIGGALALYKELRERASIASRP